MDKPYVSIIVGFGPPVKGIDLTYEEFANLGNCYEHLSHTMRENVRYGTISLVFADKATQVPPVRVRSEAPALDKENVCPHGKAITDERYPGLSGNCTACRGRILGNVI